MAAFAMRAHMRKERGDAMDDAHEIDVDHPAPGVDADVVDAAAAADAGIVADDVNVAELCERRLRRAFDSVRVGDVANDRGDIRAVRSQRVRRIIERPRFDVCEHHVHAFVRETFGEREADAARRAGNEGGPDGEILHESPQPPRGASIVANGRAIS